MKKETFPEIEDLCKDFCESPFQEIEMASGDQSISLRRRSLPKVAQFQPKDEPKEEQVAKISPSEEDQSLVVGVHRVGLFFPSVKSGDRISKGQVIGHIKAMNIQKFY